MKSKEITLHDYFAAKAMQGMLANTDLTKKFDSGDTIAEKAYMVANNMIIQRFKNSERDNNPH